MKYIYIQNIWWFFVQGMFSVSLVCWIMILLQVINAVGEIFDLLQTAPPKGPINNYDPNYADEFNYMSYGGFSGGPGGRGGGRGGFGGGRYVKECCLVQAFKLSMGVGISTLYWRAQYTHSPKVKLLKYILSIFLNSSLELCAHEYCANCRLTFEFA